MGGKEPGQESRMEGDGLKLGSWAGKLAWLASDSASHVLLCPWPCNNSFLALLPLFLFLLHLPLLHLSVISSLLSHHALKCLSFPPRSIPCLPSSHLHACIWFLHPGVETFIYLLLFIGLFGQFIVTFPFFQTGAFPHPFFRPCRPLLLP